MRMRPHFGSSSLDYAEVVAQGSEERWQEYRKLRNRFFIIFLSFPPGAMFIAYVFSWAFHTLIPGLVAAFVWIAAFLVTGISPALALPSMWRMVLGNV